jgi:hypothetical protein
MWTNDVVCNLTFNSLVVDVNPQQSPDFLVHTCILMHSNTVRMRRRLVLSPVCQPIMYAYVHVRMVMYKLLCY